jgi:prolyl 4-hydroxylase
MTFAADSYRAKIGAWVKGRLMRHPDALKIDCEGLDLFVVRRVVTPEECAALIDLIEQDLTPPPARQPGRPEFRTSHSCNVRPDEPLVQALEARIHAIVGIQPDWAKRCRAALLRPAAVQAALRLFPPARTYSRRRKRRAGSAPGRRCFS